MNKLDSSIESVIRKYSLGIILLSDADLTQSEPIALQLLTGYTLTHWTELNACIFILLSLTQPRTVGVLNSVILLLQTLIKENPAYPFSYLCLADVFLDLERFDEAAYYYKKCLDISEKSDFQFVDELEGFLSFNGYDAFHMLWQNASFQFSNTPNKRFSIYKELTLWKCWLHIGQLEMQRNHEIEAIQAFENTLKYSFDQARVFFNLGNLFIKQNHLNKAREYYVHAIDTSPFFFEAWIKYIDIMSNLNDLSDCSQFIKDCLQICKISPKLNPLSATLLQRLPTSPR